MQKIDVKPSHTAAVLLIFLVSVATPALAGAKITKTNKAGDYTIRLEILPVESFVDPPRAEDNDSAGKMVNGGGADPVARNGEKHPNHHLAVFIKKNDTPVKEADVAIRYGKVGQSSDQTLPVARMWVAGKGRKTTHFGNNVDLAPGRYHVQVRIDQHVVTRFQVNID